LSRINGLNYLLSGAVTLSGPVVAALLLEIWQIHQILWIDVGTFLIALVPLLLVTIPSVTSPMREKSSFIQSFLEGLEFTKKARGFLSVLMLATALNFLLTPLSTLLPYFVKFDHFGEAPDLAFVSAFFQGGILAGGVLMSLIKGFKRKMIAVTASIYIIFLGYALVSLTPSGLFWFMALSALIMAFCVPIANVSIQTIMQTVIPLDMQGRVSSVTMALASAATPMGMILSGVIVESTRTASLFLGCAVAGVILLTLSWFLSDMRHVEKLEQTLPQQQTLS
jgi:DHA3 family macrolide efflux protein-like MFS transporter